MSLSVNDRGFHILSLPVPSAQTPTHTQRSSHKVRHSKVLCGSSFIMLATTGLPAGHPLTEESSVSSEDFEASSQSDRTSTNADGTERASSSHEGDFLVGKTETRAVNWSKGIVYLVILLAAAGIGTATYLFTSKEEENDFENEVRRCQHLVPRASKSNTSLLSSVSLRSSS